jgi:hypothetical protein
MRIENLPTIEPRTGNKIVPVSSEDGVFSFRPRIRAFHYFYMVLICAAALAFAFYYPDRKAVLIFLFFPPYMTYLLFKGIWATFAKTEICLSNELTKKFSCTSFIKTSDSWNWSKIKNLRLFHRGNPEKSRVIFSYNMKIVTLAKNLRGVEAKLLQDAIAGRIERSVAT